MNPRLLRPLDTGFNPRKLAGLEAWFDASDSSTVTLNGSTISEWRDKSGNGRHLTQATAASQPTYTSAGANGRNVATFGGSQHMASGTWPLSLGISGVAVARFGGDSQAVLQRGSANDIHSVFKSAGSVIARRGVSVDSSSSVSNNVLYVLGFRNTSAALGSSSTHTTRLRVNGVAATEGSGSITTGTGDRSLTVGGLNSSTFRLNGIICEIILYGGSALLSDAQMAALEKYAARRWGITL
jgi:hypothetical protein